MSISSLALPAAATTIRSCRRRRFVKLWLASCLSLRADSRPSLSSIEPAGSSKRQRQAQQVELPENCSAQSCELRAVHCTRREFIQTERPPSGDKLSDSAPNDGADCGRRRAEKSAQFAGSPGGSRLSLVVRRKAVRQLLSAAGRARAPVCRVWHAVGRWRRSQS